VITDLDLLGDFVPSLYSLEAVCLSRPSIGNRSRDAALCSQLHCPGGGSFLSLEEGWLGRGLLIPMSPWKKLATCKKMGDMAGGSGIFRVSSDLFCQSPQIH
jgi:hypothetical protein